MPGLPLRARQQAGVSRGRPAGGREKSPRSPSTCTSRTDSGRRACPRSGFSSGNEASLFAAASPFPALQAPGATRSPRPPATFGPSAARGVSRAATVHRECRWWFSRHQLSGPRFASQMVSLAADKLLQSQRKRRRAPGLISGLDKPLLAEFRRTARPQAGRHSDWKSAADANCPSAAMFKSGGRRSWSEPPSATPETSSTGPAPFGRGAPGRWWSGAPGLL